MEGKTINNQFYDTLGTKWYEADDHPIALLRAENRTRAPWVAHAIAQNLSQKKISILDVGCGAGFLSNFLARQGYQVTGVDLSLESLEVARERDLTGTTFYCEADAYGLPFEEKKFDVVCAMDLLEHVEDPKQVIQEAARVLKPGGLFFFHTFNRNWLSWLVAIKGVEWFVANAPKRMHLYALFIKPKEMKAFLTENHFTLCALQGFMPKMDNAFFQMLKTRKVPKTLTFELTSSPYCGYLGFARLGTHNNYSKIP